MFECIDRLGEELVETKKFVFEIVYG